MRRFPLAILAVSGGVFLALVALMQFDPDDFVRLDTLATAFAHPLQILPWVEFFIAITTLGSATGVIAIAFLVVVVVRKESSLILRLVIMLIGESVSVQIVKSLIGRVRPDALPWIGSLHSFSFPSGHAASAMALFGFIAVVGYRRLHERSTRSALIFLCALAILAVGASRIVLAAHYFSDVLAGYLLGTFWLALVFVLPLPRWLHR
jgi:membrane-associated phospholipid phosphatase